MPKMKRTNLQIALYPAHNDPPHLHLHCLPSFLWIPSIMKFGGNILISWPVKKEPLHYWHQQITLLASANYTTGISNGLGSSVASIGVGKMLKVLHLSFLYDGQGTVSWIVLYVDKSCLICQYECTERSIALSLASALAPALPSASV